jgi:hypothetical protein
MNTKSETQRTPGPWHIGVRQPSSDKFIYGKDGTEVADCDSRTNFKEENLANAHLIASAPELLDFVKRLNTAFYAGTTKEIKNIMAESKGLIHKAEGRAS